MIILADIYLSWHQHWRGLRADVYDPIRFKFENFWNWLSIEFINYYANSLLARKKYEWDVAKQYYYKSHLYYRWLPEGLAVGGFNLSKVDQYRWLQSVTEQQYSNHWHKDVNYTSKA